jgi:hypothetical protein
MELLINPPNYSFWIDYRMIGGCFQCKQTAGFTSMVYIVAFYVSSLNGLHLQRTSISTHYCMKQHNAARNTQLHVTAHDHVPPCKQLDNAGWTLAGCMGSACWKPLLGAITLSLLYTNEMLCTHGGQQRFQDDVAADNHPAFKAGLPSVLHSCFVPKLRKYPNYYVRLPEGNMPTLP